MKGPVEDNEMPSVEQAESRTLNRDIAAWIPERMRDGTNRDRIGVHDAFGGADQIDEAQLFQS